MNPMKTNHYQFLLTAGFAAAVATALFAAKPAAPSLARGEYLVEKTGMCADCHSMRNERGEFIPATHLGGAALGFAPTVPMPVWSPVAAPIAGLPSMTTDQAVAFLMTGKRPDGTMARPPMPQYRYDEADARAIAAYLKSLAPVSTVKAAQ